MAIALLTLAGIVSYIVGALIATNPKNPRHNLGTLFVPVSILCFLAAMALGWVKLFCV